MYLKNSGMGAWPREGRVPTSHCLDEPIRGANRLKGIPQDRSGGTQGPSGHPDSALSTDFEVMA